MFAVLLGIAVTALLLGGAVGAFYAAWRSEDIERWMLALIGALCIVMWLVLAAMQTGQLATVPPGCYRISETTSTGIAVGAKGAVPVVMSGRTYEPIPCP